MKHLRPVLAAALLGLLAAGCHRTPAEFTFHTYKGERSWQVDIDDSTTMWVHNSYDIQWPDKGCISADAERRLMQAVFGADAGADMHRCRENYLNSQGLLDAAEDVRYPCYQVDALPDTVEYTEQQLGVVGETNGRLATITVTSYIFPQGAAHGSYDITPLMFDLAGGDMLALDDIVDTTHLGTLVARAVDHLPANSQVKECLFDEFSGAASLPVSKVFCINDAMDTVYLVYGLYWLTPYACGVQQVALPVSMLDADMALTERGRALLVGRK